MLSCVLNFGAGGTGPNDVTWTGNGISSLSASEYAIDKVGTSSSFISIKFVMPMLL